MHYCPEPDKLALAGLASVTARADLIEQFNAALERAAVPWDVRVAKLSHFVRTLEDVVLDACLAACDCLD